MPASKAKTASGSIARKYAEKYRGTPTRTLARMMIRDYPGVFTSLEQARNCLRYHRGEKGIKDALINRNIVPSTKFNAPESDAMPPTPYIWTRTGAGMIIADPHSPYHDKPALELSVNYAIKQGATDFLIILGDMQDNYQLSRFVKDPRRRIVADEVAVTWRLLDELLLVFPFILIKLGNHDYRWERFVYTQVGELAGLRERDGEETLSYRRLIGKGHEDRIDFAGHMDAIHVGEHLTLLHGHEYPGVSTSVNPARGLFLKTKSCAVCGHFHRSSFHPAKTVRGKQIGTWSLGCCCELMPEYMPYNEWNHGFALFHYTGGDDWDIDDHRIVNGEVR